MARLSKSRFISGWQCPLKLWFDAYQPELASEPDEAQEALFATGQEVGEFARARWAGGVLVEADHRQVDQAAEETARLLADPGVPAIFEGVVVHENTMTRADILARNDDGTWDLIEVKSATRVKEPFDTDVAVQYWILRQAGFPVGRAGLLLLDREYVYPGGPLDLKALFRFEDLAADCEARLGEIGQQVAALQAVLAQEEPPVVGVGEHCYRPYECPYLAHCMRDMEFPEHPIDILPHLKGRRREGLVELGIERVEDIPDEYPLTDAQERVRRCIRTGEPWLGDGLHEALRDVEWPLHFLDFEAVILAIPRYPGMRPYDQLPFQFSCHTQPAPGAELEHHEFLAQDGADPRDGLAAALLDAVGDRGSIIVYSNYEARTIEALAAWLPHRADRLRALHGRLKDLLPIIREYYCHADLQGSYSIKQVLPVLVPELSYEGMEVADGKAAGRAWLQMLGATEPAERERLDRALRLYCGQDSVAMSWLREALLAMTRAPHT